MLKDQIVSLTIEVIPYGKRFQALGKVKAPKLAEWSCCTFDKTPLVATRRVMERIKGDLSPSKRGPKHTGYQSLLVLEYGGDSNSD